MIRHQVRTCAAMFILIKRAAASHSGKRALEVVTGNNDADAVYFLNWAWSRFAP